MLTARIYRISRGQVRELPLEEGHPVEIAVDIDDGSGPGLVRADVRPGRCELPLWPVEILPMAMQAVERMAPWATVYAAPTWLSPGGDEYSFWGQARRNSDANLLTTSSWGTKALDTLHHELWHVLEQYLLPSEWAAVVEACSSGPAWVDQRYYATPTERAARAFAAWCVARVEAPTPPGTGWRAWVRRWAMPPARARIRGSIRRHDRPPGNGTPGSVHRAAVGGIEGALGGFQGGDVRRGGTSSPQGARARVEAPQRKERAATGKPRRPV